MQLRKPINYPLQLIIFLLILCCCLSQQVSTAGALFLGILLALLGITPLEKYSSQLIKVLLQVAVVGLGFGMNIRQAISAGKEGFVLTLSSIFITLALGILLGRRLKLPTHVTLLIAAGTAICGGSAIAAIAPILSAKKEDTAISLGIIFLLNAVALLLFPFIGGILHLSQHQFGLWSAIAIQDTSSVVAAAASYGNQALKIATTVKLERALWIIPVSLVCLRVYHQQAKTQDDPASQEQPASKKRIKIPWFIFIFLVVMVLSTYIAPVARLGDIALPISKKLMTLTLFFIGTSFTRTAIKKVGMKPLLLGLLLWIFIGSLSLIVLRWVG